MEYKEFVKAFKPIEQFHLENELANEAVKTFCASSYAVCDIGCALMDSYVNLLASVVGDKGGWISWYVFENDFGKGGLTAGMKDDKKMKEVNTLKKLYNFIKR